MIITSLLHSLFLHHYYMIITHYYICYYYLLLQNHYYVLLHHYYIIITSLLHHYYFIITKGKSCNNDYIITCYAKGMPLLLHYYYVLLRHYYTRFYYYPLLPISISRTCRWQWMPWWLQRYDFSRVNASAWVLWPCATWTPHGVARTSNRGCPCVEPERFMRHLHSKK